VGSVRNLGVRHSSPNHVPNRVQSPVPISTAAAGVHESMGTKASEFAELVRGASVNQLAQLFDLDRRTVANRLKDVQPCGKRNSFPVYKISEVAELLVVGYMSEDKLTKAQQLKHAGNEKDYWDSQLKRIKYLENTGDLWRTERIVEVFAMVFKQIRESTTVFIDALEHESGLPPKQIDKAKHFGDALLVEMRDKLLTLELDPVGEHDFASDPFTETHDESDDEDLKSLGLL